MRSVILFLSVLLVAGCASMRVEDFRGKEPQLVLQDYFDGHLTAYGIIKDRRGKVTSSFRAAFEAYWDEDGAGVKLVRVLGPDTTQDFDPFLMLDAFDSRNPADYTKQ